MRLQRSSISGFTLIELMVTVAVVAILMVAATPSFLDALEKARLRGVADQAVDFINSARIKSVKQGRDVNVAFRGSTSAWCMGAKVAAEPANPGDAIGTAAPCACNTAPTACLVAGLQSTLDSSSTQGITISALPSITFDNRLGTVSPLAPTATTLTSQRQHFKIQLTVTPLAQVSQCVPTTGSRAIPGIPSC